MSVLSHTEIYTIRTYEIDFHRRATVPALVRLMQEAAMQHVLAMQLSIWDLAEQHLSWILMRQHLWIDRLPQLGEVIRVMTWPTGFERLFTYRDFRVFDAAGNDIARSATTWLLMDTRTRRMSRIPTFITDYADRLLAPDQRLPRPADRLNAPQDSDRECPFIVNWHDLDFNAHLNNTLYVQWLLEATDRALLENGQLCELEVHYRAEARWGEHLLARARQAGRTEVRHRLQRQADGKDLAIARSLWRMDEEKKSMDAW